MGLKEEQRFIIRWRHKRRRSIKGIGKRKSIREKRIGDFISLLL